MGRTGRIRAITVVAAALTAMSLMLTGCGSSGTARDEISVQHYWSDAAGTTAMDTAYKSFAKRTGIDIKSNPIGQEDFKTAILAQLSGSKPPDVFTYGAGARIQKVVSAKKIQPIDDVWDEAGLERSFDSNMQSAATYDGQKYSIPLVQHTVGFFYNKKVFAKAGIKELPRTWEEFLDLCAKLKQSGTTPITQGAKNGWEAQFWFDMILLRTAGPEYRAKLMDGSASYQDPEVKRAMEIWSDLLQKDYFTPDANAYDWTGASDKLAKGEAGMTLFGTWITGYLDGIGQKPGEDYDYFEFPVMDPDVPKVALGPVDSFVLSKDAANPEASKKFLAHLARPEVQTEFAKLQGGIATNSQVPASEYNSVIQKAHRTITSADDIAFNYDIATPDPVASVGLTMFSRLMHEPKDWQSYLRRTEDETTDAFANA